MNIYIHTNLIYDLKIYLLGVTWIWQNLDSLFYSLNPRVMPVGDAGGDASDIGRES